MLCMFFDMLQSGSTPRCSMPYSVTTCTVLHDVWETCAPCTGTASFSIRDPNVMSIPRDGKASGAQADRTHLGSHAPLLPHHLCQVHCALHAHPHVICCAISRCNPCEASFVVSTCNPPITKPAEKASCPIGKHVARETRALGCLFLCHMTRPSDECTLALNRSHDRALGRTGSALAKGGQHILKVVRIVQNLLGPHPAL